MKKKSKKLFVENKQYYYKNTTGYSSITSISCKLCYLRSSRPTLPDIIENCIIENLYRKFISNFRGEVVNFRIIPFKFPRNNTVNPPTPICVASPPPQYVSYSEGMSKMTDMFWLSTVYIMVQYIWILYIVFWG